MDTFLENESHQQLYLCLKLAPLADKMWILAGYFENNLNFKFWTFENKLILL